MRFRQWGLAISLFSIATVAIGQKIVSGTVTDDTGESLIGVTVLIKNEGTGSITDIDGKPLKYGGADPKWLNPEFIACSFAWFDVE